MSEELAAIRQQIDQIDDQLVPLLGRRIELALSASAFKRTADEVRGCDRVLEVLDKVADRARRAHADEVTIVEIYRHLIQTLTALQLRAKGLAESC